MKKYTHGIHIKEINKRALMVIPGNGITDYFNFLITFEHFTNFTGRNYSFYTKRKIVIEGVKIEKNKKVDIFSFPSKLLLKSKQTFLL